MQQTSPIARRAPSLERRQRNDIDSRCVVECCQTITDLENYILAELKAFKIVVGIIKRALEKVTQLINIQNGSRNLRCMMLFTTIMYQVLELIESSYTTLDEESERHRNRSMDQSPSLLMAGLGLGDLCMDPEEQSAWSAQIILKESNQAAEVVRKIKALASVGPNLAGTDSSLGKARELCYIDLEMRFKDLANRIANRR